MPNSARNIRLLVVFLVIAYFGLAVVGTLGFVLNAKIVKKETLRQTAVERCKAGRRFLVRQHEFERMILTQEQLDQLNRLAYFPVPTLKQCEEATG